MGGKRGSSVHTGLRRAAHWGWRQGGFVEPPGPQLEAPEWAAVCPPGPKADQEEPSPGRDRVSRVEPDIQMVSNEEDDQLETRVGKTGIIHRVCYLQLLMF